ncbi:MAG: hypothetical protein HRT40_13900 [Campylobacteraceae bacterium]|nr:hypothetical protein [Campylobacteraceae bacterium]
MKQIISTFIMSVFFIGCTNFKNIEFEGLYTYGHEVSVFRTCNDKKTYWLNGKDIKTIEDKSLALAFLRSKPYQRIYIKFSGSFENREMIGFEDNYDGLIYLDKLKSSDEKIPLFCK